MIDVDEASVARLFARIEKLATSTLPARRGADLVEARSVELAPIKTGNLESGFRTELSRGARKIKVLLGFTPSYAAEVHELPKDARGPRTRAKQGNQYGPAGPGYLLRAIRGVAGDGSLERTIGEAYEEEIQRG